MYWNVDRTYFLDGTLSYVNILLILIILINLFLLNYIIELYDRVKESREYIDRIKNSI